MFKHRPMVFVIMSCVSIANMSRHVREADEVEASHKPIFRPLGFDYMTA